MTKAIVPAVTFSHAWVEVTSPTWAYVDVPPVTWLLASNSVDPFLQLPCPGVVTVIVTVVVPPLDDQVNVPPVVRAAADADADLFTFDFGVHLPMVMVPVSLPQKTDDAAQAGADVPTTATDAGTERASAVAAATRSRCLMESPMCSIRTRIFSGAALTLDATAQVCPDFGKTCNRSGRRVRNSLS